MKPGHHTGGVFMLRLRFIAIVIALAMLTGCATHQRRQDLTHTLDAYASALRWGGFEQALQFVEPDWREGHRLTPLQTSRYKQVRVVGYDAGQGPASVAEGEVRQTVRIDLVNRHTLTERAIIDHQVWKWDPEAKRWWLTTGLPDITREKPER
jgi:hypothetical protein